MLSSHLAMPREGHLEELIHIFAYLKKHMKSEMVFDPSIPDIDMSSFQCHDWSYSIYSSPGDTTEESFPPNMPTPKGGGFKISCSVDADNAGEFLTQISRTGFIFLLNNNSIYWHTKKLSLAKAITFESEFMVIHHATEYLRGLRYKLRMFGITIDKNVFVHGDNQSVLLNTTLLQSNLNKKSQSITFQFVCEVCAADEWRTAYINTALNVANLMMKPLSGEKVWRCMWIVLHRI